MSPPKAKCRRVEEIRISELPSDIIRMIIDMDQKLIDETRLISPHWNNAVRVHLTTSNRLPVIKQFKWKLEMTNYWRAFVRMAKCDKHYFGVEKWNQPHAFSTCEEPIFDSSSPLYKNGLEREWLKKRFERFFLRCSRIERLEVGLQLELMERAMDRTIVDELITFMCHPDTTPSKDLSEFSEKILKFVRDHSVKSLVLHMGLGKWRMEMKFFAAFVNEEAPVLSKIEFNLTVSVNQFYNERQLLDEWKAMINGLINNKMYSVTVENKEKYGGYHIISPAASRNNRRMNNHLKFEIQHSFYSSMSSPKAKCPRVDELGLPEFPSDIIRRIIDMNPKSIDAMRWISPHWNNVMHEYLSTSKRVPVIKQFKWNMEMENNWRAQLRISKCDKYYFGVEKWSLPHEFSICGEPIFEASSPLFKNGMKKEWLQKRFGLLFLRSSRIERLEIGLQLYLMEQAMDGKIVDELVTFTNHHDSSSSEILLNFSEKILKFVRDHSVKGLVLNMGLRNWRNETNFFSAFFNEEAPLLSKVEFNFSVSANQFNNDFQLRADWKNLINGLSRNKYSVTVGNKNEYSRNPLLCVILNRMEA